MGICCSKSFPSNYLGMTLYDICTYTNVYIVMESKSFIYMNWLKISKAKSTGKHGLQTARYRVEHLSSTIQFPNYKYCSCGCQIPIFTCGIHLCWLTLKYCVIWLLTIEVSLVDIPCLLCFLSFFFTCLSIGIQGMFSLHSCCFKLQIQSCSLKF